MLKDAASCSKLLFLPLLPQPLQHALLYELLAVCFFSPNRDSAQWAHYRPALTRFSPSSWISVFYRCSNTHPSLLLLLLLLCSVVSVWTLRNTRVSWVWCSWWICWPEWCQGWSTWLKWASSTSGWLHTRWGRLGDAGVSTAGGRNLDFLWMSLFKEMLGRSWNRSLPAIVLVPGVTKALIRRTKVLPVEMEPVWLPRLLCLFLRCSSTPTWAARCLASGPFRRTRLRLCTPLWWEWFNNTTLLAWILRIQFKLITNNCNAFSTKTHYHQPPWL